MEEVPSSKPMSASGLKIRRRPSSNQLTSNPNRPDSRQKQEARKFLEALSPSDYERAVAFMGATNPTTRIHLNTTMRKLNPDLQSKLLDFLDLVEIETCELLLSTLHPFSPEDCGNLFVLQYHIDFDRYLTILKLSQENLNQFLSIMNDMDAADMRQVFKVSLECGMSVELLLELMITQREEDSCPMCKARRRIKKEFLRIHDFYSKNGPKYNREKSIYEYELFEKRDFALDPLSDFFSISVNPLTDKPEISLSDAAGRAIATKQHKIDTKLICDDCKREVYEYALRAGNDAEIWHTLWQDRLDMHEQARDKNVMKSKWWGNEIREIEYKDTVRAITKANKNTKRRKREERKRLEEEKKSKAMEEERNMLKMIKKKMITDALDSDNRWMHQELNTQRKSLDVRNLAASLEFETDYGLHEDSTKTRKNPRSSKLEEYHPISKIPLTKAAASAAFGTDPIIVEDESAKLREYNFEFKEAKEKLDWRRDEQRRQREASERANFEENLDSWRRASRECLDKINQKYKKQEHLRTKKIEKRDEQKRINRELRNAMRLDAEERAREAAKMEMERQRIKKEEEAREAQCRFDMGLAESDQRAIDRFWGLPTDAEKKRRLEEFLRRQFEARIRDKRAMMVAVGGEISVPKTFAKEVPDILGVEKFRIKTVSSISSISSSISSSSSSTTRCHIKLPS